MKLPNRYALGSLAVLLAVACVALAAPAAKKVRAPSARHGSITQDLDCGACHTPHGWKQLASGPIAGGFDHARTGFPLTGRHAETACVACHDGQRKMTRECVSCHADAHQRRFGEQCDDCHSSTRFEDVRALELHRSTRLPLTGMHALADCTQCHQRTSENYRGVPADCFACHARDYRRSDIHPLHVGGVGTPPSLPFPRDCGLCHRASAWQPAVISSSELRARIGASALLRAPPGHDLAFAISFGPHKGAQCADCHRSEALPRAVQCTGCHAHQPMQLAEQHRNVAAFGRNTACLQCHPGGAAR